jgi:Flp pilus assembly protein TadG
MSHHKRQRGSQTLEFTLIGLPLTFLLFSIANMCFAMMTLHTIQEAVEQGARFVVTRGSGCSSGTNTCSVTVQQIADAVASGSPGVSSSKLGVTLIPASGSGNQISCSPLNTCTSSCSVACNGSRSSVWPAAANSDNAPGKDIIITGDVSVTAPMFMFWAGVGATPNIGSTSFHAYSRQRLMF